MKDMNLMSQCIRGMVDPEEVELISDGFHSFKELYDFRLVFNACLFNEWARRGVYSVHKSRRHGDGEECFGGGWFIVMATTPFGQVSNHYRDCHWGIFECESREQADAWDGHSASDVVDRLLMVACAPRG